MAVEEWRFPGTLGTTSAWQERTVINTYDPWKVGWLFEAPRGVKMAYLLIRLPVKMFCYVRLMDFFLGLDNPDCFGLFSPFPGSEEQWVYFIIGNPDFIIYTIHSSPEPCSYIFIHIYGGHQTIFALEQILLSLYQNYMCSFPYMCTLLNKCSLSVLHFKYIFIFHCTNRVQEMMGMYNKLNLLALVSR